MLINNIDALIFDIDGTLWDAAEPSAAAWQKVADEQKIDIQITPDIIRSISGTPCVEAMKRVFGANYNEKLREYLDIAEQAYIEKNGGTIYPDVLEVLEILNNKYKLFLVSNCDSWYLKSFLDFGFKDSFKDCLCNGDTGLTKDKNIIKILEKHNLNPDNTLYIGDTSMDAEAAAKAGIHFIFVKYGFGSVDLDDTLSVTTAKELIAVLT